jgi:hypothetical protein
MPSLWHRIETRADDIAAGHLSHRTAQQCGDYKTSTPRRVDFDEWLRFGFKDSDAAYQFRAEAEKIASGFVEPPDAEWQR